MRVSAVVLHCGKAHAHSHWEGANFDPNDIKKNPWNFSNLNFNSMITSAQSTPVPIFISLFVQIDEILRFCDFFHGWLQGLLYFFQAASCSDPLTDFHVLWLIWSAFAQGRSFWGLRQYPNSFRGNIPQNSPKWAWIGNFKPNRQNIEIAISCTV